VLPSAPAVLSIGQRCLDHGYSFRWPAGKLPHFFTPSGVKVKFIVEDYIPYLRSSHARYAACAVISLRKRRVIGNHHTQSTAVPRPLQDTQRLPATRGEGHCGNNFEYAGRCWAHWGTLYTFCPRSCKHKP
jgi:hypothetical protein